MSARGILYLSLMLVCVPVWVGLLWVEFLRIKGTVRRLLHAWVLGFATMLAVSQLLLVPLVALEQTLTTAMMCGKAAMQILAAAAFLVLLMRKAAERQGEAMREVSGRQEETPGTAGRQEKVMQGVPGRQEEMPETAGRQGKTSAGGDRSDRRWVTALGVLAAVLVLLQAYIPARYEHSDDDDARFIAEEVSAVEHDTMYQDSPIYADYLYWNEGEVRKDLTSPWAMFVAILSKSSGIAPAALSHAYLPFFLILICYALYLLIGQELFHGDWEKSFVFLIFLSVVHLAGYTSTHTLASMLLLRIWQGKAVCASFSLPLFFYLFFRIMRKHYDRRWLPVLYVASTGACLLSGIGIVTAPVMLCLYGILDFCYYRNWRKTLAIWMAALPCAVFLGYYLM